MKNIAIAIFILVTCLLMFGCAETIKTLNVDVETKQMKNNFKSRFGSDKINVTYEYNVNDGKINIIDIAKVNSDGSTDLDKTVNGYYENNKKELEKTNIIMDCIEIEEKNKAVNYNVCRKIWRNELSIYTKNSFFMPGLIVDLILSPIAVPFYALGKLIGGQPDNPFVDAVERIPDPERVELLGKAIHGRIEHDANLCKVEDASISQWYKGECQDGKANGRGIAIGTARYAGDFVAGKKQGSGEYVFADGKKRNGLYFNDIECTEQEYKYKTDEQYARNVDLENYRQAFRAAKTSAAWNAFIGNYKSYDPDKLLTQAHANLNEALQREKLEAYRSAFNRAKSSVDYAAFVQQYANYDPDLLIAKAQVRKKEALQREKEEYRSVVSRSWSSGYKVKITYTTASGKAFEALQKVKDAMHVRDPWGLMNPYWVTNFPAAAAYDDKGVVIGEWYTSYYQGWNNWGNNIQKLMDDLMDNQYLVYSWEAKPLGETQNPYVSYQQSAPSNSPGESVASASGASTTNESSQVAVSGEYKVVKTFPLESPPRRQVVAEVVCGNGNKGFVTYDASESYYKYKAPNGMFETLKLSNGPTLEGVAKESCR